MIFFVFVFIISLFTQTYEIDRGQTHLRNLTDVKRLSFNSHSQYFSHQGFPIRNRTHSRALNYNISEFIIDTYDMKMKFYNPSITYVKERLLFCSRFLAVPYDYDFTRDTMGCSWFPSGQKSTLDFFMLRKPNSNEYIYGEDPRVIALNNSYIHVVFNYLNVSLWSARKMCVVDVKLSDDYRFHIASSVRVIHTEGNHGKIHQKNWSPFIYNSNLYYIYSIEPHLILQETNSNSTNNPIGKIIYSTYSTKSNPYKWLYGDMRGGTPAILIKQSYLTFFHSKKRIKGKARATYFIGAYTFSKDPPFSILSISTEPIVGKGFYEGKWAPQPYDYILYPTSFTYDEVEDSIHLYFGRQDVDTWFAKLNVTGLLKSLIRVNSST